MRRLSRITTPLWRQPCAPVSILLRFLRLNKGRCRVRWHGYKYNCEELLCSWVTRLQSNLHLPIGKQLCGCRWWRTAAMWRNLLPNRRVQRARWRLLFVLLLLKICTNLIILKIMNSLYSGTSIQGTLPRPRRSVSWKEVGAGKFQINNQLKKGKTFILVCDLLHPLLQGNAVCSR